MRPTNKRVIQVLALLLAITAFPPGCYPEAVKIQLSAWFGAPDFRPLPASSSPASQPAEPFCPDDLSGWRAAQQIEGVAITAAPACVADNPYLVAAAVRGTNNISQATLLKSGLTADAVTKGADLDGDGDPDEIHIRLEVAELNGSSPVSADAVTRFSIAPGIEPGLWVFAPKLMGMAVANFESQQARLALRLPSPALRIEQGDRVKITLENSHYMPHTLHLHGADHGFVDAQGNGNDGVPITSEMPVLPGSSRTYELTPRQTGTMFYHCHVQPHVHVMMGLQGLFIIEENLPNNWLQTMNVGAGLVRAPSRALLRNYTSEYDLHYQDLDKQLGERIRQHTDPRLITRSMHRQYNITNASADYFTLNGQSFPYTFRESLIVGDAQQRLKLRVVNGGLKGIALHTHGHKFEVTHKDGIAQPQPLVVAQDVVWLATSERVDLALTLENDGLHAYGPGIWPFHDHQYAGVTTDGIGPGGNISAIVYSDYLADEGWPRTQGVPWDNYFTAQYYALEVPVWEAYAPGLFATPGFDWWLVFRVVLASIALSVFVGLFWRKPRDSAPRS